MSFKRPTESPTYVIDRLIRRWAKSDRKYTLHPLEAMRLMHDGAVLGGAPGEPCDDEAAFDRAFCEADELEKAVVNEIYTSGRSIDACARRFGLTRDKMYTKLNETLHYFRGAMRSKGFRL